MTSPAPASSTRAFAAVSPTGIVYMLLACASFATLDVTAKIVVATVPILMALWVRFLVQAVFSSAMLWPKHGRGLLRTGRPWMQVLRGSLLLASTMLGVLGVKLMPVGEFTAIVMATPLAVTVMAVWMFKERVVPLHWVFVGGGFVGMVLIVRPGGGGFGWAALAPLGCLVTNSLYQIVTSLLARTDHPATTHFYSGWFGATIMTLMLPFTWAAVDSPRLWLMMGFMGVIASIGHFSLATAFRHGNASSLMPFVYTHLVFAVFAGWLVFSHLPDGSSFVGIALIAASGVGRSVAHGAFEAIAGAGGAAAHLSALAALSCGKPSEGVQEDLRRPGVFL